MSRRSVLIGGGLGAAALLAGRVPAMAAASLAAQARLKGIIYGSSTATWQFQPDPDYAALFKQQAGALFTEDDLLWYRLRPTPTSALDFSFGDQIVRDFAANTPPAQPVVGAHLVWDEGFGAGWTDNDLFGMTEQQARSVLFSTIDAEVARYAGQVKAWVAANEVTDAQTTDPNGYRTNVPWYQTIGPEYVEEVFQHARAQDPGAMLILNDFGFETGQTAVGRRAAFLKAIDYLNGLPIPPGGRRLVDAVGIQAHMTYQGFARQFKPAAYRQFLADLAARNLTILITEMDVLDDGLRGSTATIDAGVADVYARYLAVALDEPAVKVVLNFGLSDRYTWLQEDFPRRDGIPRRPLPFDANLQPKPAYDAIFQAFTNAPSRTPLPW